jgi:hypothetical protein
MYNNFTDETSNSAYQLGRDVRSELEFRIYSFNLWKKQNVKFESNTKKLFKKNWRTIAIKWAQRGLLNKAQRLAKKRAGLKKQKALADKKLKKILFK